MPQLEAQVLHTPVCSTSAHSVVDWAGAAGEQTADHGCGESGEADQQQLNPPASRQRQRPGAQALTRVLPSSSE